MGSKIKSEKNKQERPQALLWRTFITGFVGGVLWSVVGVFVAYFNFTVISPASFVIRPWLNGDWTNGWLAELISVIVIGFISVLVAYVYYFLLRRLRGILPSILFGLVIWAIVFGFIARFFPNIAPILQLDNNTIVTTICLYVLYGVFIGYTISYDFLD